MGFYEDTSEEHDQPCGNVDNSADMHPSEMEEYDE